MKRKWKKLIYSSVLVLLIAAAAALFFPTWTPSIEGERSIHLLKQVNINGAGHEVMIRGKDRRNPVLLFVHGGPGCSEIPYVRKYQDQLEQSFTIVHYDQRGSGKSYHFGEDYSHVTAELLIEDLLALTDYVSELLEQDHILLAAHSYGTYIGLQAAARAPEKYRAYIGIGQVADHTQSELDSLHFVLEQARLAGNQADIDRLEELRTSIEQGEGRTPRGLIRKYGGAARLIDDNGDYVMGFLFGSEYNGLDVIRYLRGIAATQEQLLREEAAKPLTSIVREIKLPVYFVMGKYDYMTSTQAAAAYFEQLKAPKKEFVLFEQSAHYPQFEEKEQFASWLNQLK
ncbi:alpha/beta fold hydrolase [Paenibacillus sp. GCM10027626]|uniref:alpha/beta fold hydrolase n=1 Tax=Paenibacillus sp. GCM10027626 TaxID=3273411 RepID=UPI0036410E56